MKQGTIADATGFDQKLATAMPPKPPRSQAEIDAEQAEAWIGDAALALVVRQWILRTENGRADGEKFARITSNQFLSAFGQPTAVEARIGRIFSEHGLEGVMEFFEKELAPLFAKQERNRRRK